MTDQKIFGLKPLHLIVAVWAAWTLFRAFFLSETWDEATFRLLSVWFILWLVKDDR